MLQSLYRKPDFDTDGADWPHRAASRFVRAGGVRWHVQILGEGPAVLLLHGTGASAHSFRDLVGPLAKTHRVLAPDLPGHGFTSTPEGEGLTLEGMARSVHALLKTLGVAPELIVGHSAGAAVALRLCLDRGTPPRGVVSLNGALEPFPGSSGSIFPLLARLLFLNPLAVQTFAWRAGKASAVERLIESTGSRLDETGLRCYQRLFSCSGHVAGALGMMSRWRLDGLRAALPAYKGPLLLVAADGDLAVPPRVAEGVGRLAPQARLVRLPGLGHLSHEEDPAGAAALILSALAGGESATDGTRAAGGPPRGV